MDKNFWTNLTRKQREKIIGESMLIDFDNQSNLLDYDDDTELCGYYEENTKYGIWLAVYDGFLEWTLDEHAFDEELGCFVENDFENVSAHIWNTKLELDNKIPTDEELAVICKNKLKEMIIEWDKEESEKEYKYLKDKEKVCPLDKEERYILQQLEQYFK